MDRLSMNLSQPHRWVTGAACRACLLCLARDGHVRGLSEWRLLGLPGSHAGCDCSLQAVQASLTFQAARPWRGHTRPAHARLTPENIRRRR
jgi:hypothetical protein